MPQVRRGEVWFADLGTPVGSEQGGDRPVVVLQIDRLNTSGTTVIVPTTTSANAALRPATVALQAQQANLQSDCVVKCDQIRVLAVQRFRRKLGDLPPEKLSEIEATVAFVLGLPT